MGDQAMSEQALDRFGEVLMRQVRDEAISDWHMILDGKMKDAESQEIRSRLDQAGVNRIQLEIIRQLVHRIVDTTLHHLLWTLEQEKSIDVSVRLGEEVIGSLRDLSDGLAGELYNWAPRFSKETFEAP